MTEKKTLFKKTKQPAAFVWNRLVKKTSFCFQLHLSAQIWALSSSLFALRASEKRRDALCSVRGCCLHLVASAAYYLCSLPVK